MILAEKKNTYVTCKFQCFIPNPPANRPNHRCPFPILWEKNSQVPDFYMEGMSHDSTPCTDCRSFRSSICSSPPVFPGIETFFPGNHRSSGCPERPSTLARQVYYLYASPLDQPPIDVRSEVETIHEAFAEAWVFPMDLSLLSKSFKHMGVS